MLKLLTTRTTKEIQKIKNIIIKLLILAMRLALRASPSASQSQCTPFSMSKLLMRLSTFS